MSVSRKASTMENKIYLNGQLDFSEIKGSGLGIGSEPQDMELLANGSEAVKFEGLHGKIIMALLMA